jgi:hypothetical protein
MPGEGGGGGEDYSARLRLSVCAPGEVWRIIIRARRKRVPDASPSCIESHQTHGAHPWPYQFCCRGGRRQLPEQCRGQYSQDIVRQLGLVVMARGPVLLVAIASQTQICICKRVHTGLDFLIATDVSFVLLDVIHVEQPASIVTAQVPRRSAPCTTHYACVFGADFAALLTLLQFLARPHL